MPEARRDHTVCVRLSDAEQAKVDAKARELGLVHVDGEPNRSATLRRMALDPERIRDPQS